MPMSFMRFATAVRTPASRTTLCALSGPGWHRLALLAWWMGSALAPAQLAITEVMSWPGSAVLWCPDPLDDPDVPD